MTPSQYLLATAPACPHCAAKMALSALGASWIESIYENSHCPCWWDGAADGIYPNQVRQPLTDEQITAAAAASGEPDPASFITARQEALAAASGEREFSQALHHEKQTADLAKLAAFATAHGFTARKTLKQQWYAHWSKGDTVILASRLGPGYGPQFVYLISNNRQFSSIDLPDFLRQAQSTLTAA